MTKRDAKADLVQAVLSGGRTTMDDMRAEFNNPDRQMELKRLKQRAKEIAEWVTHVGLYVIVIGFLFVVDLFSGDGWWFFWPALGWGVAVASHTWSTFGPRAGEKRIEPTTRHAAGTEASVAQIARQAADKVDELRRIARRIPKPAVRRQALELLASADQVVAALGDGAGDETMARTFLDRYLGPTSVILERYQRLAVRGISSAEPVLNRVEAHDLPLLNRRMKELHDKLHEGDVIDLQVASEMLAFELDDSGQFGPTFDSTKTLSETRS